MRDYHFVIKDGCADGILPDGTHFLIDADMIPTVEKYGFHLNHKGYPYVPKFVTKTNNIFLHWLVLGYTERPEFQVDHINRIKTDCRRCNLRPVTNQQNTMNRKLNKRNKSGYTVRRLTPTECARFQGFPDNWCSDLCTEKPSDEEMYFWHKVFKTYSEVTGCKMKSDKQIAKWLKNPYSDSAEYKMWGNGVALPCVWFVLCGIVWYAQSVGDNAPI